MRNKWVVIGIICVIVGLLTYKIYDVAVHREKENQMIAVPVEIIQANEIKRPKELIYEGKVVPKIVEKVSFKLTTKLMHLNGKVGDEIASGKVFIQLDQADQQLVYEGAIQKRIAAEAQYDQALNGATKGEVELAKRQMEKAEKGVKYLISQEEKIKQLLEEGIVSQNDYDSLKFKLDLAESDYDLAKKEYERAMEGTRYELIESAKAQLELAKVNEEAQNNLLSGLTYTPKNPMILIDTQYEEGELIPAGYPVAILRSKEEKVIVGVTSKELDQLTLGQEVVIEGEREKVTGSVTRIAEIPDNNHFLYEVDMVIDNHIFKIGELVTVTFVIGEKKGVQVPISAISNDGIDYVYVIENSKAKLQKITIIDTFEGEALVHGLEENQRVILTNLNRIKDQTLVQIKERQVSQ